MTYGRGVRLATATAVVLTTAGGLLTTTTGSATAATSCASPNFKREFFANTTFSGTVKRTDCDPVIDENWGTKAPGISGFPADKFSVRATLTRDFGSGGPFTFAANAQDGVRVYLDGVRKIDLWKDVSTTVWKSVDLTVPAGKHTIRVDFVNWTGNANVKFRYEPRTSATVDKVTPLTTTGIAASYDPVGLHTKLTWSQNVEMDLAGYRVYRRLPGTPWPATPLATTTSPWHRDYTAPRDGKTYYYDIRAVDKAGNESAARTGTPVTTAPDVAPAPPTGVEDNWALGYTTEAKLYWDANSEPDLAGYRVYRATTVPVEAVPENLVSGPALLTSPYFREDLPLTGDGYYYVVTAVDRTGHESAPSQHSGGHWTEDKTAPTAVARRVVATDNEDSVTLNWEWSEGSVNQTFEVIRTQEGSNTPSRFELRYGTTFTDTYVERGAVYTYVVHAADDSDNLGPASEPVTVHHVGDVTPPAPVTGLTATAMGNGIQLDWDGSAGGDVEKYRIEVGTRTDDGDWAYTVAGYSPAGRSTWTDSRLPDGETLRYRVVALDEEENQVAVEEMPVVEVTELNTVPTVDTPPVRDGLELYASRSGDVVDLSINNPYSLQSPNTAFRVYRWDGARQEYVLLAEVPVGDTYPTYWTDTSPLLGQANYYRATAVYADGTESAPQAAWVLM